MAGLLYSAALQADLPAPPRLHPPAGSDVPVGDSGPVTERVRRLTAEEVRQLMIGTVDSMFEPSESLNPQAYPSGPGFVRRFGYGRVNARKAVDAILAGAIPPQVEIESPEWFQVLGKVDGLVPVKGRISLRSGGPGKDLYDYVVEWAPGVDPKDGEWQRLGGADGAKSGADARRSQLAARRCGACSRDDGAGAGDAAIAGPAAQRTGRRGATDGAYRKRSRSSARLSEADWCVGGSVAEDGGPRRRRQARADPGRLGRLGPCAASDGTGASRLAGRDAGDCGAAWRCDGTSLGARLEPASDEAASGLWTSDYGDASRRGCKWTVR